MLNLGFDCFPTITKVVCVSLFSEAPLFIPKHDLSKEAVHVGF